MSQNVLDYAKVPQGNLEGDVDVPLAHISGKDKRREMPREMFQRKPGLFLAKFFFAIGLIAAAVTGVVLYPTWPMICLAIFVNGMIFAHLIELQHECMHGHAFRSPGLNRFFGVASGIFLMSSNSHYRYDHLRHHAYLGTERNIEHFNYRFQNLDSIFGFARAFFDLSRYKRVFNIIWLGLIGKPIPGVDKPKYDRDIKHEYYLYAILLIGSIVYSVVASSWLPLLVWWLPAVLIGEGVHFMIEMPEHFGLNTQTQPNVLSNTRTIRTSPIVAWFVNGNDLHTAHHYHHGVPMCNIKALHKMIKDDIVVVEPSYFSLYRDIIAGRIKHAQSVSCMDR